MGKTPKVMKPPTGEAYVSIEAPKGELGYFIVSDNSTQPYRLRVRPPSFINLQALDRMVRGGLVADVVAIIGTLDIVLGESGPVKRVDTDMGKFLEPSSWWTCSGALGHVPQSESEIYLYRAVSGRAAQGGRALSRRAAAEHQSG